MDDWNSRTVTPLTWETWKNNAIYSAEMLGATRQPFRWPPAPYVLQARPMRTGYPPFGIVIGLGCEPIWLHVTRMAMVPGGGMKREKFEYVVMGYRDDKGAERVWMLMPDGQRLPCATLREALS